MPYFKPPMLPEKDLPLPFADVLDYHLRSELLEHRDRVSKFDLSGFDGQPERTVDVTFAAPKWQMERMAEPIIEHFVKRGDDEEVLKKTAEQTITDFIGKSQSDGWTATRKQGDVTVHFNEAIGDDKSLANPERNLTKDLVFEDDVRFSAVDGRAITTSDKSQLAESLPSVVKWLDSAAAVEKDGVMLFHPVVEFMDTTNVCVYPSGTLAIGGQFIAESNNQGLMLDILRHERGHIVNGDLDASVIKTHAFKNQLQPVDQLYTAMKKMAGYIANPITIEGMDHQKTIEGIHTLGDEMVKAMKRVSVLADKVRSYEWYDELTPLFVAADMDNKTSFQRHLFNSPKFDLSGFKRAESELLSSVEERQSAKKENLALAAYKSEELLETRQALMEQLGRVTPEQQADLKVALQAFQHVSMAREYLADVHSVQHSEDPDRFTNLPNRLEDMGITGGYTHPENSDRSCNAKHFADRVLHQREQAAKEAKDGQSR